MKAILTVGLPGSGKSSWARKFASEMIGENWVIIERDAIREILYDDWPLYKPSTRMESIVTSYQDCMIIDACLEGKNIVISDTNLNKPHRDVLSKFIERLGYEVFIKSFAEIPLKQVLLQNRSRKYAVPEEVIHRMAENAGDVIPWAKAQYSLVDKVYEADKTKPPCVIVDMDGTIADMAGIRKPFEFQKVDEDEPHISVMEIIESWVDRYSNVCEDLNVIIVTAREDIGDCKKKTEEWLDKYAFKYDKICIRKKGDHRKDNLVKEEIFWNEIVPEFDPIMVFDDRRQVVKMWKNLGLPVMQVHHPFKNDDF